MPNFRVSPVFQVGNDRWQYDFVTQAAISDPTGVGTLVGGLVETNLIPQLGNDCQFLGCQVGDPYDKLIGGRFVNAPTQPFGGAGAASLPSVACATVTLYMSRYGRGRRGRWFLSGIPITGYAQDALTAAYVAALQGAVNSFFVGVNGDVGQMVIHSRTNTTPPFTYDFQVVEECVVRNVLREQRRREQGRSIPGRR